MIVNVIPMNEAVDNNAELKKVQSILKQFQNYQVNPNVSPVGVQKAISAAAQIFNNSSYKTFFDTDAGKKTGFDAKAAVESLNNANSLIQQYAKANATQNPQQNNQQKGQNSQQNQNNTQANQQNGQQASQNGQADANQQNQNNGDATINSIAQKFTSVAAQLNDDQKKKLLAAVKNSLGIKESTERSRPLEQLL